MAEVSDLLRGHDLGESYLNDSNQEGVGVRNLRRTTPAACSAAMSDGTAAAACAAAVDATITAAPTATAVVPATDRLP